MNKLPTSMFCLDVSWICNLYFWAGRSSDEENSGIRGLLFHICKILNTFHPKYLVACIDSNTNFRKAICPLYKANRPDKEEDYISQLAQIKEAIESLGIPQVCIPDYESDDVIATFSEKVKLTNTPLIAITADKDLKALLRHKKFGIYRKTKGKPWHFYSQQMAEEEHGIRIEQFSDFLVLVGDSSDNIKTVHGIGVKTASKLLSKYDTIEGIYENLGDLSANVRKNFENFRNRLEISRELIRLVKDVVGVPDSLEQFEVQDFKVNRPELHKILVRNDIVNLENLLLETLNA